MLTNLLRTFIIVIAFSVFVVSPSHAWLIYHKPELRGKVIDAETKEPIEGAVVVVVYYKTVIRLAPESFDVIKNIRETVTGKDGIFTIPSYTSITDPLSFDFNVEFIIYKPGYGSFPKYQKTPSGITRGDHEVFFSGELGSEGELELWIEGEKRPERKRFKVKFGIVELPKLKTKEERRKALLDPVGEKSDWRKQKQLIKAIRKEWQYLTSKDPSDLYKVEEE